MTNFDYDRFGRRKGWIEVKYHGVGWGEQEVDCEPVEMPEKSELCKKKSPSGRYVYSEQDNGCIPIEDYYALYVNQPDDAPMTMGDIEEHRNMVTGEIVTTRRRHREIMRANPHLVEVGNETNYLHKEVPKNKPKMPDPRPDIAQAIKQLGGH